MLLLLILLIKHESSRVTAELKSSHTALTIAKEESARIQTTLNSTRAEDRQLLDDLSQRADRLESLLKTERAKVEQLQQRLTENEEKQTLKKTGASKVCINFTVADAELFHF